MNNVRTVSDAKREFYQHHSRPVNSIYRRIVDELLVEMHLLSVNDDFVYDAVYALGVVTTFDCFMQGYQPEGDNESIFGALCRSTGSSPEQYRGDAESAKQLVSGLSLESLKAQLNVSEPSAEASGLVAMATDIAKRERFKYSRPFGIGLYTLLELIDADALKDKEARTELLAQLCDALGMGHEKLQKDVELYRSNIEKFAQAQEVMKDMLEAGRKKREEREQALAAAQKAEESGDTENASEEPAKEASDDVEATSNSGDSEA